jgi:hypothetical protein
MKINIQGYCIDIRNKVKKIRGKTFYITLFTLLFTLNSCSDMLSTDNDSMVSDPGMNSKTDSVFYALGIAQAMQQVADQYFYIGELRGELVTVDEANTDKNLKELANYSASQENAYDSSYVFYKVINNCNYYLAHRDSTLKTGSTNVVIDEYIAVAAWRAWAYLQLARIYCGNADGLTIPFFTEPLTSISQIEGKAADPGCQMNLSQIVDALAPELEQLLERYPNTRVPTFGTDYYSVGTTNWGENRYIDMSKIFIPIQVVLGDMYLETAQYEKAAKKYADYLCKYRVVPEWLGSLRVLDYAPESEDMSYVFNSFYISYLTLFMNSVNPPEILTYIPMAVSSQNGKTTSVPLSFGYDYYSINHSSTCPRVDNIQIEPSKAFYALTDSSDYYYYPRSYNGQTENTSYPTEVKKYKGGDGRASVASVSQYVDNAILYRNPADNSKVYVSKVKTANVYLYRASTVYLHLAEALNAMGYTDAAFAILKNGISTYLENLVKKPTRDSEGNIVTNEDGTPRIEPYKYMSQESVDMLGTTLPFLSAQYREIFNANDVYGIHAHGSCSYNSKENELAQSAKGSRATALGSQMNNYYLPDVIIGDKMKEIAKKYDVGVGTSKTDSVAAMLDLLCDEYAKEFAFEGRRFYDLQRIARHFNEMGIWGGNFGSRWFVEKLSGNRPQKDLHDPRNWYLPFK